MEHDAWETSSQIENDWPSLTVAARERDGLKLVGEYMAWCQDVRHRSSSTIRTYGTTLRAWIDWLGEVDALAVDATQMERFVTRPRPARARGNVGMAATQRKDVAILRGFYQYLWERGHTPTNLAKALHGPTVRNEDPHPIPKADWLKLWDYAQGLSDSSVAALGLGYVCGLRRHEITGLHGNQITPTRIVSFQRKGGGEHTLPWADMLGFYVDTLPDLLPHPERFTQALQRLSRRGDQPLVAWPSVQPDAMNKRMVRWCKDAGVASYSPHALRHSCATNLLAGGVPIHLASRLMNHASIATTMRYVKAGADEFGAWRNMQH